MECRYDRTSGVATPEFGALFGTAEAVPSRDSLMRWLLIEGEGNKQELLVALDLQSDRRSWRQSLERTTQTLQGSHGLAIQRANHVSGVQRHFHTSARRLKPLPGPSHLNIP